MKKKIWSLVLALVLMISAVSPVLAVGVETTTTETVTLHKLLLKKEDLSKWDSEALNTKVEEQTHYNGNALDLAGVQTRFGLSEAPKEIAGVYFQWFYATGEGEEFTKGAAVVVKRTTEGYVFREAVSPADDNLPDLDSIQGNIDNMVQDKEYLMGGKTLATGFKFPTAGLSGKFLIDEIKEKSSYNPDGNLLTEYKAVPVKLTLPMVNEEGIVADAHVYPKNTQEKPQIDKNFAKDVIDGKDTSVAKDTEGIVSAGAAYENYLKEKATVTSRVGEIIPYEVKTKVPAKSDYEHLVWSDTMTNGLTYNQDAKVSATGIDLKDTDYELKQNQSGYTLTLKKSGLDKIKASETDVEFTIKYSATINSSAVVDVADENEVRLDYGHKPKHDNSPKPGKPSNGEIKVTKTWDENPAPTGVKVQYFLWEGNPRTDANAKVVAQSPVLEGPDYTYTFKDLDNNKQYYVEEHVSGYTPEYTVADGSVTVKNTKDNDNPPPLIPTKPKVVTYGKKFVKTNNEDKDSAKLERLVGAELIIADKKDGADIKYLALKSQAQAGADETAYNAAQTAYLDAIKTLEDELKKPEAEQQDIAGKKADIETKRKARDKAFVEARTGYEWTTDKTKAFKLTSDHEGRFEIKGLKQGTYYLVETKAPTNFANLTSPVEFAVGPKSYEGADTELQYTPNNTEDGYGQQVKNKVVNIPQTGGIGTVIFTVAGLAIMTTAVLSLKKRQSEVN